MESREAEALWKSLRDALTNVEEAIKGIITEKAWKPLGFETFSQAWDARMKGVTLANSIKPYVIYAMLDERVEMDDIASLTGWGIDQVKRAAEDYNIGVPVAGATVIRRHVRSLPSEPRFVRVEFPADELAWLNDVVKATGLDMQDEARKAIRAHFRRMESRAVKGVA